MLGTPYPTGKQMAILKRQLKDLFANNKNASYATLVRTVEWCKARKKRPPHSYTLIAWIRYAWADGYLPELDAKAPVDEPLESLITEALEIEADQQWRYKLIGAQGIEARRKIFESWKQMRLSSPSL
jgi:hypothetical protein